MRAEANRHRTTIASTQPISLTYVAPCPSLATVGKLRESVSNKTYFGEYAQYGRSPDAMTFGPDHVATSLTFASADWYE